MGGIFSLEGVAATLAFAAVVRETFRGRPGRRSLDGELGGSLDKILKGIRKQTRGKSYAVTVRNVGSANGRVGYIIGLIKKYRNSPEVRAIAAAVLSRKCGGNWCIPEKDWWREVAALFKFTRQNVRYTRDVYNRDTYQSPPRTLQMRAGDCDCYVVLLGALLQSVGYPIRLRIIQTHDMATWNHIYLLVGLPPASPEEWYALDASMNRPPGWQAPAYMVKRFRDFEVE